MKHPLRTRAGLTLVAVAASLSIAVPAAHAAPGDTARGSVKIENQEFTDPGEPDNEVKVGCAFRIDFYGFDEQSVPVTFTMMEPSGNDERIEARTARIRTAKGNNLSGSLNVDLSDDLRGIEPAQARDYDYKVKVEAQVKESEGTEITKSAMLFIVCEPGAGGGAGGAGGGAGAVPAGGVAAGFGGSATSGWPVEGTLLALGLLALAAAAAAGRRTARR
jgi:hypothetical protein